MFSNSKNDVHQLEQSLSIIQAYWENILKLSLHLSPNVIAYNVQQFSLQITGGNKCYIEKIKPSYLFPSSLIFHPIIVKNSFTLESCLNYLVTTINNFFLNTCSTNTGSIWKVYNFFLRLRFHPI